MRKLLLLSCACVLWACSDSKSNENTVDSGSHPTDAGTPDGAEEWPDQADAAQVSPLGERPPGSLERPPEEKLPDSLKPPGFER
jgi:hypothetical protein